MHLFSLFSDVKPPEILFERLSSNWIPIAIGAGLLFAILTLLKLTRGRRKIPDLQHNLREDLAEFPPAPAIATKPTLEVDGVASRLRLIVIAPAGKQHFVDQEEIPGILDEMVRGLSKCIAIDKPRIKVWPAQLSASGFAPTFYRLVQSPDVPQKPSRWLRIAGQTKIAGKPVLIGMAFYMEEPIQVRERNLNPADWHDFLELRRSV